MDARSRYTNMVIRQQMLALIKEKPVDKITVKELCDRAEINRATFYKYYSNPADLLEKMEKDSLDALEEKIKQGHMERLSDIFRIILKEIAGNFEFYQVLFFRNGDETFRKRMFDLCYSNSIRTIKERFPNLSDMEQEWLYYFAAEGIVGVLSNWIEGNMQESIREVLRFLNRIIISIDEMARRFSERRKPE